MCTAWPLLSYFTNFQLSAEEGGMRVLRFLQSCDRGFRSFGIRRCVVGCVVSDVSKERVAFIFKCQQEFLVAYLTLANEGNAFLRNVGDNLPTDTTPCYTAYVVFSYRRFGTTYCSHHQESSNLLFLDCSALEHVTDIFAPKLRSLTTNLRCVTSQKNQGLNCHFAS